MPLGEWLRQYLAPGGGFYRAAENFHPWEPGKKWDYCRVAYGLAGHLVESIAGTPFPDTSATANRNEPSPAGTTS